jgi:hypothetical protein
VDETRLRSAAGDRHLERVDDELGAEMVGHRPADHAAAVAVDYRGEVQPARPGRDMGDLRDPKLVRRSSRRDEGRAVVGALDATGRSG